MAHKIESKKRTEDIKTNEDVTFEKLGLCEPVLRGLTQGGFLKPSPIQFNAIPLGRIGLDLMIQAKSGTGKTCVFAVVALEMLDVSKNINQVLILAPTREIAVQNAQTLLLIGKKFPGLKVQLFIGGLSVAADQVKSQKCHIAVGTPGRVKQLIKSGQLKTSSVGLFVLDEADKLMEDSFIKDINWIYGKLPDNKQVLALSATYPEALANLVTRFMRKPRHVRLAREAPSLIGIRQFVCCVAYHPLVQKVSKDKLELLHSILSSVRFQQCLVFSNYQTRAETLAAQLLSKSWPSLSLCACQDQSKRLQALSSLKQNEIRILVATDLAARGIDAPNVDLVVNLEVPRDQATYLHRIGRAGRFGSLGIAITLASQGAEVEELKKMALDANAAIRCLPWSTSKTLKRGLQEAHELREEQKAPIAANGSESQGGDAPDMVDTDVYALWDDLESLVGVTPTSHLESKETEVVCVTDVQSSSSSLSEASSPSLENILISDDTESEKKSGAKTQNDDKWCDNPVRRPVRILEPELFINSVECTLENELPSSPEKPPSLVPELASQFPEVTNSCRKIMTTSEACIVADAARIPSTPTQSDQYQAPQATSYHSSLRSPFAACHSSCQQYVDYHQNYLSWIKAQRQYIETFYYTHYLSQYVATCLK